MLCVCSAPAAAGPDSASVLAGVGVYARVGANSLADQISPAGLEDSYIGIANLGFVLKETERWQARAEVDVARHAGEQTHWEGGAFVLLRWHDLPWDDVVDTSVGIGDGVSYASRIPALEQRRNGKAAQLLNLLVLEVSFPVEAPSGGRVLLRLHHRSGAWGALQGVYAGSNFVAAGLEVPF